MGYFARWLSSAALAVAIVAVFQARGWCDGTGTGQATENEAILSRAEEHYARAQESDEREARLAGFRESFKQYQLLRERGVANAELYTNLGNAALQAEDLGQAVLAYRRALVLDPDHPRATQNLGAARKLLPEWLPHVETGGLLDSFFFWHRTLARDERSAVAAAAFALALFLFAAAVRWRKSALRNLALLPAAAWVVLVASLVIEAGAGADDAVVITPEGTVALSEDSTKARPAYTEPLPPGTEITIRERRDSWLRVRLAGDTRDVWITAGAAAPVVQAPSA